MPAQAVPGVYMAVRGGPQGRAERRLSARAPDNLRTLVESAGGINQDAAS